MSLLSPKRTTSLASSIVWRFVFYSTTSVAASAALLLFIVLSRGAGGHGIPEEGLTIFFITLLAVFGILSAVGGWFLARWLSRLFAYLSHNARRVAEGDYSTQIPRLRHTELEALAESIRSMVTAVREREEQYRELNRETRRNLLFQRTLLEAINLPMVYYNLQGDLLGCNSRFEKVMGVTRDRLLHLQEMGEAPEPLRRLMKALTEDNDARDARTFERELLFDDDRIHTIIIHRAPYFIEEGSIDGHVCALLDITEYRLTEDAFQRLIQSTVGVHGVDFFIGLSGSSVTGSVVTVHWWVNYQRRQMSAGCFQCCSTAFGSMSIPSVSNILPPHERSRRGSSPLRRMSVKNFLKTMS